MPSTLSAMFLGIGSVIGCLSAPVSAMRAGGAAVEPTGSYGTSAPSSGDGGYGASAGLSGGTYGTRAPRPVNTSSVLPTTITEPVAIFQQCGGLEYTGSTMCAPGLVCEVINEWYSLCTVDASLPGIPEWQQCGGMGFTGTDACVLGTECVELGPYYSQCLRTP